MVYGYKGYKSNLFYLIKMTYSVKYALKKLTKSIKTILKTLTNSKVIKKEESFSS